MGDQCNITIRPLHNQDRRLLERHLITHDRNDLAYQKVDARLYGIIPTKARITESLRLMEKQEEVCLIAWIDQIPVGWLHIRWKGDHDIARILSEKPQAMKYVDVPAIYDVWMKHTYRSQGVGRVAIEKAVEIARAHKFSQIGLVVDVFNQDAIRFYKNVGFKKTDVGVFETNGSYRKEGRIIIFHHGRICIYSRKSRN